MRVAVLIKQVPRFEAMALGADGRLQRAGLELEMNPYCRRAVSKGVELAVSSGGSSTVITLGPPTAEDSLREAVAWGADEGVLVTDPTFGGSDTLATARALAAALVREGPFDLVLAGRNSVDADTGQVGPEMAELLGLPFLAGVRELAFDGATAHVRCEHDDGWITADVDLPALMTCAERLCEPCKVDPAGRAAVDPARIRRLTARDLGPGPWGQDASPTRVGDVRVLEVDREPLRLSGPIAEQVRRAVAILRDRGALGSGTTRPADREPEGVVPLTGAHGGAGSQLAVLLEPDRPRVARELLGAAAHLASEIGGRVVALAPPGVDLDPVSGWGADQAVVLADVAVEEDVAHAVLLWASDHEPWAILAPGTMWGREVSSRVAARLGAGLTGDAVALAVDKGRLVGWKPAFGGHLVAAITAMSRVQMVTVRPGVLALRQPRPAADLPVTTVGAPARSRVRVLGRGRDDDLDALATAEVVVGVGTGVRPEEYAALRPLLDVLGAELATTRKVTDKGWLPRSRQIGITGRSVAPRLYVALGIAGKFNHLVGVRGAGAILAVNNQPDAVIFGTADVGIVGDWHDVVPRLVAELSLASTGAAHERSA